MKKGKGLKNFLNKQKNKTQATAPDATAEEKKDTHDSKEAA